MVIRTPVTRNLFFTGKGGVGKTSVASATAVGLADEGKRVLLVSTDPASNLDEVFGVELGMRPTPIPEVPGLFAMNIDPEAAATGVPRADGRALPGRPARRLGAQHGGAVLRCLHDRDRRVRRVLAAARRRLGHGRVRSRHLRHGPHGAHAPAAPAPRGLDGLLREQRRGELLPRPALGAGRPAGPLRVGPEGTLRPGDDDARARHAGRGHGPARGGPHESRACRTRHPQPAARRQRPVLRDRSRRPRRRGPGGPRPLGARGDPRRARRSSRAVDVGLLPFGLIGVPAPPRAERPVAREPAPDVGRLAGGVRLAAAAARRRSSPR